MDVEKRLAAIRGNAPESRPSVRKLAAYSAHGDCNFATLALVTRTDLEKILVGTDYEMDFGQDPQAFARGAKFESNVKEMGFAALLALLREKADFPMTCARIADLRNGTQPNMEGLRQRAAMTRQELRKIARGDKNAANIIEGAVLACKIAGRVAYFEADGLAAAVRRTLHVVEMKSFPCTDGRCDNDKLGAACDQAAWYALLCRLTLADLGLPTDVVSDRGFIVVPEGIGLAPTLLIQHLGAKIRRAERLLASMPQVASAVEMAAKLPFPGVGVRPSIRLKAIEKLMDAVGTSYHPDCLQDCGMARKCRARAHQAGQPSLCGSQVVSLLPGVTSLNRAAELAAGAKPRSAEVHAAAGLASASTIYDHVLEKRAL